MNRKSFLLYLDTLDVIQELTDAQIGKLFRAIVSYQHGLDDPDNREYEELLSGDSLLKIAFTPFKSQFDRDFLKYKEVCEKRVNAGRKGGIAKASKAPAGPVNPVPAKPVKAFGDIIQELNSDQLWIEQMCRQSGIGAKTFLGILPEQINKFFDYISATGQEDTVLTTSDAKKRFFWWWKNQGIESIKPTNNGRKTNISTKPDIQPSKPAEKDYSGSF